MDIEERNRRANLVAMIGDVVPLELLRPLGEEIYYETESLGDLATVEEDQNPFIGLSCYNIENLLGLCFVACQVFITKVVSICMKLEASSKEALLRKCSAQISNTDITQVQAIDALANYFKHRDQWPDGEFPDNDWGRQTVAIIKALGCRPGSSRNLRAGFEAVVGDAGYARTDRLIECLEQWAGELRSSYAGKEE